MSNLLEITSAKNVAKYACVFAALVIAACDGGDSAGPIVIADVSSSSSEELLSSSEEESSSSSEFYKKGDFLNPDIKYDTLVDARDGQIYSTVTIGNLTWMAENLNYADSIADPNLVGASKCVDERDENCNVLGRLYDVKLIIEVDSSKLLNKGLIYFEKDYQGICPDGWRIPSMTDWINLLQAVGHCMDCLSEIEWDDSLEILMSKKSFFDQRSVFNPDEMEEIYVDTDLYGFSALPMNLQYWYSDIKEGLETPICCASGPILVTRYYNQVFEMKMNPYVDDWGVIRCVKGMGAGEFRTRDDLLNPKVKYDTLVDERDGQIYRTYDGIMAENLNYDDGMALCYNNDERLCALYGRLYGLESIHKDSLDNLCPEGWRLLTDSDADELYFTSEYMGWYKTDSERDSVFGAYNVFPAGFYLDGEFWDIGFAASIYVSEDDIISFDQAYSYGRSSAPYPFISPPFYFSRDQHVSVRCAKKDR